MIKICVPIQNAEKRLLPEILKLAALFVGMMGMFISMLRISVIPALHAMPLRLQTVSYGFMILLNRLFDVSEYYQAYQYDRFAVTVPADSYYSYIVVALAIIAIIAAAYIFVMMKLKSVIMCVSVFMLATGLQIYLGVFAVPVWNIIFYAAIVMTLLDRANPAIFVGVLIIIVLSALLSFPGANPALGALSESIRDRFGEGIERPIATAAAPQEVAAPDEEYRDMYMQEEMIGQGDDRLGGDAYGVERNERFAGSQIGLAILQRLWILGLIFLAFFIGFAVRFLVKLRAAYKRRAIFDSADCSAAINGMFRHLMQWLVEFGLKPCNCNYDGYASQLEPMLSAGYAKEYLGAVDLWQKAAYSNHAMTEDDKKRMRLFLNTTVGIIAKKVNPLTRARIWVRLLFRKEDNHANL